MFATFSTRCKTGNSSCLEFQIAVWGDARRSLEAFEWHSRGKRIRGILTVSLERSSRLFASSRKISQMREIKRREIRLGNDSCTKIVAIVGDAVQQSCDHGDMLIHNQSPLVMFVRIPDLLTLECC